MYVLSLVICCLEIIPALLQLTMDCLAGGMPVRCSNVTGSLFSREILKSSNLVFILISWCGPPVSALSCSKIIQPTVGRAEREHGGRDPTLGTHTLHCITHSPAHRTRAVQALVTEIFRSSASSPRHWRKQRQAAGVVVSLFNLD